MPARMTSRSFARPNAAHAVLALGAPLAACSSKPPDELEGETAQIRQGQKLFSRNCGMCHTLSVVGSEGSATEIHDRERPDGPNFDVRAESKDAVLYAIRNGGFSGAIMPENIVVGEEAEAVAEFLAKYAGRGGTEDGGNPAEPGQLTGNAGGSG